MKRDIRLDLSFSTHRKRKKLAGILGPEGVLALVDLWLAAAQNRPKGILTGMNEMDIALDAQWGEDPVKFCKALCDVGFLDRDESGIYAIHDWKDHQPFIFHAEERSARAREAASARWMKKISPDPLNLNATGMQDGCGQHTRSNAPSPNPSPNPTPSPKKRKTIVAYGDDFSAFWREYPPRNGRKDGKKQAWEEWRKLSPDSALQELMLAGLQAQKAHRERVVARGGKVYEFPDFCRWLKNRRWEDEVQAAKHLPQPKPQKPSTLDLIKEAEKQNANKMA
jgi:hypothetical protein